MDISRIAITYPIGGAARPMRSVVPAQDVKVILDNGNAVPLSEILAFVIERMGQKQVKKKVVSNAQRTSGKNKKVGKAKQ